MGMMSSASAAQPKLSSELLSVGQMPVGWSVDNSSSSGGGVGCFNSRYMEPKGVTQTAKTVVYFQSSAANGLPTLNEKLATYSNTSSAYKKIVTTLTSCKSFSGKYQGHKMVGTVGQMSFGTYGTSSEAFAVDFTYAGTAAYEDSLIVRKGNVVMSINEGNLSPVNVKQFQGFVVKALAKLRTQ
jgi:hypothetical protein